MLDEPLVGGGIAAKDQLHAGVLDNEADRAIAGMDGRDGTHLDTVFVVDDLVDRLVIEFVRGDLARYGCDLVGAGLIVPVVGLEEMLNGILGTHVLSLAARPPDLQRHRATGGPATGPQRCEIAPVISMQMADKNLGEVLGGDHQRVDVAHRTGADVKDQLLAIAEFEQETG
mgnify:CR=1 FL=1